MKEEEREEMEVEGRKERERIRESYIGEIKSRGNG